MRYILLRCLYHHIMTFHHYSLWTSVWYLIIVFVIWWKIHLKVLNLAFRKEYGRCNLLNMLLPPLHARLCLVARIYYKDVVRLNAPWPHLAASFTFVVLLWLIICQIIIRLLIGCHAFCCWLRLCLVVMANYKMGFSWSYQHPIPTSCAAHGSI